MIIRLSEFQRIGVDPLMSSCDGVEWISLPVSDESDEGD